jgi:methyl-accepting chemotaxis protein
MTSRIFTVSKEQANATRSIVTSIAKIRRMADEMVTSTAEQVRGSRDIRNSVDAVAVMVHEIFQDLESRKLESASVVKEMECMRSIAT